MLKDTEPYIALKAVIEDLTHRLLDYTKTTNPSQPYINRQKAVIQRLSEIAETLHRLDHFTLLYLIDEQLSKLLIDDPEIDSVILRLNFKDNPRNTAIIAFTCPL